MILPRRKDGRTNAIVLVVKIKAKLMKGCNAYMATVTKVTPNSGFVEDGAIVNNISNVFHKKLHRLLPSLVLHRASIDHYTVSKVPYRMAPIELAEVESSYKE